MTKLEGKIALVTGGSSGIGLAAARQFVDEGAYVFITGRRDSELTAAVNGDREHVVGVRGDVSNPGDLDRSSPDPAGEGTAPRPLCKCGRREVRRPRTITEEL